MSGMDRHWFVVPPLNGPASGGTVYNRELLRELSVLGASVEALALDDAKAALSAGQDGYYWVDSLFLEQFEELARENLARCPLGLIAHYLPSLVEQGDALTSASLSPGEAFCLARADLVLAPSRYMKTTLSRLGLAPSCRCVVVEPGCLATAICARGDPSPGVRASLIANLTPGKGVEPFLRALSAELRQGDALRLTVAGSLEADPAYARACVSLVEAQPSLTQRVTFTGAISPSRVVELLTTGNLLVSASRMECFGMAIAEARTLGLPVVARVGGNTPSLVEPAAGGRLVGSDRELARVCCDLARDHAAHARALELAQRYPRPPRDFAQAARDFLDQLSSGAADGAR